MVSTTVVGRITITAPDDIHAQAEDRARGGPVRTGGAVPLPGRSSSASLDATLVDALRMQALTPGENVILTGPAAPRSRRASGLPETAQVSVAVSPGEQAVALLEQDGVYNWILASGGADTSGDAERRGGATGASIQFEIPLGASLPDAEGRRSVLGDLVFTPIRVRIFRFLGRQAVGAAVGFQERTIVPGLVRVDGPDPTAWTVGDPIRVLPPRSGTRHRVLLLVHGTFSSTAGGFGQLAVTPWGAAFLAACAATYDLVLGYDHRTLSEDPEQNAQHLLAALRGLDWGGAPPEIDLIAHSRGGLVVRTLVEALAPESGWDARFGRAILVGTTNAGTELASPSNWGAFVDLYTNLAVAACRALALLPQAAPVAGILRGTVASLGEFIKQIALGGLDGDLAPGLAAMVPTGDFVRRLNQTQTRQFDAAHSIYRVVSSAFVPRLTGSDHEPKELPRRFLHLLGSAAVTGLMRGIANDLVVDTNSMSAIDVAFGNFVCDSLHFAESPQIYHTNYFSRPEVVTALGRWLGLSEPAGVPATAPAANPQRRGGGAGRSPAKPPPPSAVFGGPFVPAAVDTRVVVVSAAEPARAVATAVRQSSARFVVVSREHEGQVLNYAYDPDELGPSFAAGADNSLLEALNLHEADADRTLGLGQAAAQAAVGRLLFEPGRNAAGRPRRTVVTEGARTVGVVPGAAEAVIGADIGALARDVAAGTRGITRRVMPPLLTLDPVPVGAGAAASARRGGTTGSSATRGRTAGTERSPEPIECYFLAETVPSVRLGSTLSIHVTVSREAVAAALGLHVGAVASLDRDKTIIIDVWPKRGFEMAEDEEPAFIDPPAPGTPAVVHFSLRSVAVGAGEIWVVARQGKLPLVTLKLRPEVIEHHAEPERGRKLIVEKRATTSGGVSPKHALTILEADPTGTQSIFRFELDSPDLGVLKRYESKPIRGDRQAYVEGLYRQIEEAWTGTVTQKRAEDFAEKLRDMGAKLWKSLLPEDLQADLWRNRTSLDSIFILSEEPFIPWELLFMVEPGKARTDDGCFLAELGLVRWLYEAEAAPPTALVVREGRARYIIPEYPEIPEINLYPLPEAEAERKFLTEKFRATGVEPQPAPVGALLAGPDRFDLLHFAGHGFAARSVAEEAQILLGGDIVGDAYHQNVLEAARIETKADFGASRPSVIINACQAGRADWKLTGMGGFAQAFLARKAGLFVGTLWSVGDHPARAFTEAFYLALLKGKDVASAVRDARQTARTAEDPTWLAYAVYAHPNAVLAMDDASGTAPAAHQGGAP